MIRSTTLSLRRDPVSFLGTQCTNDFSRRRLARPYMNIPFGDKFLSGASSCTVRLRHRSTKTCCRSISWWPLLRPVISRMCYRHTGFSARPSAPSSLPPPSPGSLSVSLVELSLVRKDFVPLRIRDTPRWHVRLRGQMDVACKLETWTSTTV